MHQRFTGDVSLKPGGTITLADPSEEHLWPGSGPVLINGRGRAGRREGPVSKAARARRFEAMSRIEISSSAARALALAAQGLHRRPRHRARKDDVLAAIRRMAALQIDTIHVVARSPYLVLWSRLGSYAPHWLDELHSEGKLFEYWGHEACFLPIEAYPLFRHRMLAPRTLGWKYRHEWMERHRDEVARLLDHIRDRGPVRSADFRRQGGRGNGWWDWKTEKRALEYLHTAGELMVTRRENFHRIYDLRERVLPSWDDARLPPAEDVERRLVLQAVRALGIAKARWVADYFRMGKKQTPAVVRRLAQNGAVLAVDVEGWDEPGYVHPDNIETTRVAANGALRARLTTLLSPFDPLVWHRQRALELFDFEYRLECYTPAPKRRYGYFVLPILRRGRLVGRLDAKAHRREGRFEVRALHLEPGVRLSGALATDVAGALQDCATWHGTPDVTVSRSDPPAFGEAVVKALAD